MEPKELPQDILILLQQFETPIRLRRHLQLVYAVAHTLVHVLETKFPKLTFNKSFVLFGAATHDIGKVHIHSELFERGKTHEEIGEKLLLQLGYEMEKARFARTHGNWEAENLKFEDLLVCLADKIWKGKRIPELESKIRAHIINTLQLPYWDVYFELDTCIEHIVLDADKRLIYQSGIQ